MRPYFEYKIILLFDQIVWNVFVSEPEHKEWSIAAS